jgi:hypothetical protein
MQHPPNPEMRSPAAGNGRANRKSNRPLKPKQNEYADEAIVSSVSVCNGRALLGHIFETDGGLYRAVAPNGLLIGSFKSRPEAAKAFRPSAGSGSLFSEPELCRCELHELAKRRLSTPA